MLTTWPAGLNPSWVRCQLLCSRVAALPITENGSPYSFIVQLPDSVTRAEPFVQSSVLAW